tara:strand:+ start:1670 stop:2512 length:843 start_codon:yes stop_codon:yes gene_type:complete
MGPLGSLIIEILVALKFRNEIKSFKGQLKDNYNGKSLIHITMNKSASQFIGNILKQFAKRNKMYFLSYNGYAFNSLMPVIEKIRLDINMANKIFKPTGQVHSFYGVGLHDLIERSDLTILLVVRDPRDICVSHLNSLRVTHSEPLKTSDNYNFFVKRRVKLNQLKDDEAYIEIFNEFKKQPNTILDFYNNFKGNIILIKYEDLLEKPLKLYEMLNKHFNKPLSDNEIKKLGFIKSQVSINELSHHRSGKHEQFKESISPKLLLQMNKEWSKFLDKFKYKV